MSSEAQSGRWTVLAMILWAETGRLDAEHLLAHALGTTRLDLYLQYDRPLTPEELSDFKPLLLRRAGREPLQHIVGRVGFRELDLAVDRRALIPRPETEVLVEVVLEAVRGREGLRALDVGTGSGCIALSLHREGSFDRIVASDVSPDALELARRNAASCGAELDLREGSLYAPIEAHERFDVIVSNPPYIAEPERAGLEPEVRDFDPETALFAGPDGLDVLRPLIAGAGEHLVPGGVLAVEIGAGQAEVVSELFRGSEAGFDPVVRADLSGRARIVWAVRR
jgi:release factor glutamine methyltransferase